MKRPRTIRYQSCPGGWPLWPQVSNIASLQKRFAQVARSGIWTVRSSPRGSVTANTERELARFLSIPHALLVSSGSAALEVALRALDIGAGCEILVPALGWYATAAAVVRLGATPVFVDVEEETSCISTAAARHAITSRTRAIIAVHLHCAAADLGALADFRRRHGIFLIEDAAQAFGGEYRGRPLGTIGDIGCFSFNQEKPLAIGEGGAVVTRDKEIWRRMHAVRTDGYNPSGLAHPGPGARVANYCMSEWAAALVSHQLKSFRSQLALKAETFEELLFELRSCPTVSILDSAPGTTCRPFYEIGLRFTEPHMDVATLKRAARWLSKRTTLDIHLTDALVPTLPGFSKTPSPAANRLYSRLLVLNHRYLLAPRFPRVLLGALKYLR